MFQFIVRILYFLLKFLLFLFISYSFLNRDNNFLFLNVYFETIKEKLIKINEKLMNKVFKIGYNFIYFFSKCQIYFNKIYKVLYPYLQPIIFSLNNFLVSRGLIEEKITKRLIFYDENYNEINNIPINKKNTLDNIKQLYQETNFSILLYLDKDLETDCFNYIFYNSFPENFDYKLSNINFLNISIQIQDNSYQLNLKDKLSNYYIINNSLNNTFLKYYLKNILKLDFNHEEFSYRLSIIDNNADFITLLPGDLIVFEENDYKIINLNTPEFKEEDIKNIYNEVTLTNDEFLNEDLKNDEQSTESESDKYDGFIKLD